MVIDASVAAKWFLRDTLETDADLAEDVLVAILADEVEAHAPRVFTYEVCGALTKACGRSSSNGGHSRLTKEVAMQCVHELFGLPIQISEASEDEGAEALAMAIDYSKAYYDMVYLRLAERLGCQWCTADQKVTEAYPPMYPRNRIRLLSSLR